MLMGLLTPLSNCRKALNDQKEMKLLLDMYKGVSKDQRDKVQLMATEKKLRSEIDDLRNQLKKMQVCMRMPLQMCPFQSLNGESLFYRKANARIGRSWRTRKLCAK